LLLTCSDRILLQAANMDGNMMKKRIVFELNEPRPPPRKKGERRPKGEDGDTASATATKPTEPANPAQTQEGETDKQETSSQSRKRSLADKQRAKLEKLMRNPDKPAHIPRPRTEKNPNTAPEFVYNVMGSSAGAGSGEFHVYRQIRRKETLRQNVLGAQKEKRDLNDAYHQKLAENERAAEERTAKKRNKRMKKKEKAKKRKEEQKMAKQKGDGQKGEGKEETKEAKEDSDSGSEAGDQTEGEKEPETEAAGATSS